MNFVANKLNLSQTMPTVIPSQLFIMGEKDGEQKVRRNTLLPTMHGLQNKNRKSVMMKAGPKWTDIACGSDHTFFVREIY